MLTHGKKNALAKGRVVSPLQMLYICGGPGWGRL
jgi:hypothetical protein